MPAGDADLCMGTCAGRDRALQESSLWGDTERERCWTGRCCSGTASVLPRSLSLELRSAPTHEQRDPGHTSSSQTFIKTFLRFPEDSTQAHKRTPEHWLNVLWWGRTSCECCATNYHDRCHSLTDCKTSPQHVLQANDQLANKLAAHVC